MSQKRFLTAAEVFQLFGVDAEGLRKLIESGDVTALPDLGTFKYRREDFAKLVQQGRLVPRTSGELFKVDDKGDMPFLKVKSEDNSLKFGEKVEFLELDEAALEEQAQREKPALRTPVVPEKWFDDSSDSVEIPTGQTSSSDELSLVDDERPDDATDLDVRIEHGRSLTDSDSDVRLFTDDDIDLDGHGQMSSGSDSDVRLVGPVSSSGAAQLRGPGMSPGDSEIRLSKPGKQEPPQSDSDVTLLMNVIEPAAHFNAPSNAPVPTPEAVKKTSDSDIQLVSSADEISTIDEAKAKGGTAESDSDVVMVGPAPEPPPQVIPIKRPEAKKTDSDSDVRLSNPAAAAEASGSSDDGLDLASLDFGDSNIRLEAVTEDVVSPSPVPARIVPVAEATVEPDIEIEESDAAIETEEELGIEIEASDPGIEIETDEPDIVVEEPAAAELELSRPESDNDSGTFEIVLDHGEDGEDTIDLEPHEVRDMLDKTLPDGITLKTPATDSDILIEVEEPSEEFSLDSINLDSDVHLETTQADLSHAAPALTSDSDVTLEMSSVDNMEQDVAFAKTEVDFNQLKPTNENDLTMQFESSGEMPVLEPAAEDASLASTYVEGAVTSITSESDSDITLEAPSSDQMPVLEAFDEGSGITIEPDSGISLEPEGEDSGITLEDADSEIRFESLGDSAIALGGEDSGISLEAGDSGISFEDSDSGISLSSTDSDVALHDSGISLTSEDSGISLDVDDELEGTFADGDVKRITRDSHDDKVTTTLDSLADEVEDSGFDVSLAGSDQTMEIAAEDDDLDLSDTAATIAEQAPKRKGSKKQLALSEAFQLDDPPEVEDLDISEDLDSAGDETFEEDFAEIEEDPVEVSDEAFGGDGVMAAVDDDDPSQRSVVSVASKKSVIMEPSWGIMAVIPIMCSGALMLATSAALWGGIVTMWTGEEAPMPASTVISMLANLL